VSEGAVHAYIDAGMDRFRRELYDFLRIPSVSADPAHARDVRRAAEWCRDHVRALGMDARLEETDGHPLVIAEWRGAGAAAATVVVYGHYDVQPPDPVAAWTTPPFEPELRDGRIHGRGAVDDKGQVFMHLKAIEAHLAATGALPANVVLVLEGEEEVGSAGLIAYLRDHGARIGADAVVISDTALWQGGIPAIVASLRGTLYAELTIRRGGGELHSGTWGGAVLNPANELAGVLGSFHDRDARVAVAGFYDGIDEAPELLARVRRTPLDRAGFEREAGTRAIGGERGRSILERLWLRPTLDIHGIESGYTGPGPKTVLPARATAKFSCRLVAGQCPDRIARLLERHVRARVDARFDVSFRVLASAPPWQADPGAPLLAAVAPLLKRHLGRDAVFVGDGGTIGVVPVLASTVAAPILLLGFGLPGSNEHAPDEWLSNALFERGIHVLADLLARIPRHGSSR
jgi:acetylornithine deacetylase/succinyl-diaminopimelate desuccinylase-like protein